MIDTQNELDFLEGSCTICHKDLKDASSLCFDCEYKVNETYSIYTPNIGI